MTRIEILKDGVFYIVKTIKGEEEGLGLDIVPKDEILKTLSKTEKEKAAEKKAEEEAKKKGAEETDDEEKVIETTEETDDEEKVIETTEETGKMDKREEKTFLVDSFEEAVECWLLLREEGYEPNEISFTKGYFAEKKEEEKK